MNTQETIKGWVLQFTRDGRYFAKGGWLVQSLNEAQIYMEKSKYREPFHRLIPVTRTTKTTEGEKK